MKKMAPLSDQVLTQVKERMRVAKKAESEKKRKVKLDSKDFLPQGKITVMAQFKPTAPESLTLD